MQLPPPPPSIIATSADKFADKLSDVLEHYNLSSVAVLNATLALGDAVDALPEKDPTGGYLFWYVMLCCLFPIAWELVHCLLLTAIFSVGAPSFYVYSKYREPTLLEPDRERSDGVTSSLQPAVEPLGLHDRLRAAPGNTGRLWRAVLPAQPSAGDHGVDTL